MKRDAEGGPGAENEEAAKRAAVEGLQVRKGGVAAHQLPHFPVRANLLPLPPPNLPPPSTLWCPTELRCLPGTTAVG